MNFLADESIDRQIVDRLRRDRHTVRYVAEMEPGISDDIVLNLANEEADVLLTADKDLGELVFRQGRLASGILPVRLGGLSPARKAEAVGFIVNQHSKELSGAFAVLTKFFSHSQAEIGQQLNREGKRPSQHWHPKRPSAFGSPVVALLIRPPSSVLDTC